MHLLIEHVVLKDGRIDKLSSFLLMEHANNEFTPQMLGIEEFRDEILTSYVFVDVKKKTNSAVYESNSSRSSGFLRKNWGEGGRGGRVFNERNGRMKE